MNQSEAMDVIVKELEKAHLKYDFLQEKTIRLSLLF